MAAYAYEEADVVGNQHKVPVVDCAVGLLSGWCGCRRCCLPVAVVSRRQPDPPISLSGTSASIASLTWSVACKENQLEKVQDELHQVWEQQ
jgi:hypothetical protein